MIKSVMRLVWREIQSVEAKQSDISKYIIAWGG